MSAGRVVGESPSKIGAFFPLFDPDCRRADFRVSGVLDVCHFHTNA